MKRTTVYLYSLLLTTTLLWSSCSRQQQPDAHPGWAYDATIYELNMRQFTPEGTFAAATAQLPALKNLGVDIIWIMPIQPIGELERKGTLGSYYAIKDYCAFNPEFGTRADFETFLSKAHDLGFKVILDWVANHTAPDHPWTQNEGWHMRDSLGNLVVNYDWYDIAELNYDNQDMREAMKKSMYWWLDTIGIDGFRCDVAMEIPTDFWENTFSEMRTHKPDLFTLAEAELPEHTENAFDMYYGWELHHLMNDVAQGKKNTADLWNYFAKTDTTFCGKAIRMNFTSNHDENSWNGTEFERLGDATDAMAAFTYVVPGMPLIYTGQEYGSDKRLKFFEKDTIVINSRAPQFMLYQKLNGLRKANSALWSNEKGGRMLRINTNNTHNNIFACARKQDNNTVIALFNFSNETTGITAELDTLAGTYASWDGQSVELSEKQNFEMGPWWFLIYTKQ